MGDEVNILRKQLKKVINDNKKLKYRNKLECEVNMELARRMERLKTVNTKLLEQIEVVNDQMIGYLSSCTVIVDEIKDKVNTSLSLNSSK